MPGGHGRGAGQCHAPRRAPIWPPRLLLPYPCSPQCSPPRGSAAFRGPRRRGEQPLGVNHLPGHGVSVPAPLPAPPGGNIASRPCQALRPPAGFRGLLLQGSPCPPKQARQAGRPQLLGCRAQKVGPSRCKTFNFSCSRLLSSEASRKGGAAGKAPGSRERLGGAAPAVTAFAQPWPQSAPREALSTLLSKHCGLPTPPFRKGMHSAESLSLQNLRVPEPTTSEGEALHAHRGTLSATTATATTATAQVADYKRVFSIHS